MKIVIIIGFFIFAVPGLKAQSIVVNEEYPIGRMMDRFVELNKLSNKIDGWRIQILATTDRSKLESAKQNFQARYPYIPVNWVHASPYYKLRVGAFETKLDATRLLQQLKVDFPSAYPARDQDISPMELISKQY